MSSKWWMARMSAVNGVRSIRTWGIVAILSGVACLQTAGAASFDCGKASTHVEKMICANATISALDDKMSRTYAATAAKAGADDQKRLLTEQKHWLKTTRDVCSSDDCLLHAYWSRQAELDTFFALHSPLFEHESDQAPAIQKILATAPLSPSYRGLPQCDRLLTDLRKMRNIRFVEPAVKTQSYEDPALDSWKRRLLPAQSLNTDTQCDPRFSGSPDPNGVLGICGVHYGTPPFKLFEIPDTKSKSAVIYIFFYAGEYGPMNQSRLKPYISVQSYFVGFHQNHGKLIKDDTHMKPYSSTDKTHNSYDGIIENDGQYYMMSLGYFHNAYWLSVKSIENNGKCDWAFVQSNSPIRSKKK